jgi:hypothetical protein
VGYFQFDVIMIMCIQKNSNLYSIHIICCFPFSFIVEVRACYGYADVYCKNRVQFAAESNEQDEETCYLKSAQSYHCIALFCLKGLKKLGALLYGLARIRSLLNDVALNLVFARNIYVDDDANLLHCYTE